MSDEMIKRCDVDNYEELYLMACILNPLMKGLDFLNQEQRSLAQGLLTKKALDLAYIQIQIKTESCQSTDNSPSLPSLPSVPGFENEIAS